MIPLILLAAIGCPPDHPDLAALRGTLRAGASCGTYVAESDASDLGFSFGSIRLRRDLPTSFELAVTLRRLSPDPGTIEFYLAGGIVLVKEGQIGYYTSDAEFAWHPAPSIHLHDDERFVLRQRGAHVELEVDGAQVGAWQLAMSPVTARLVELNFKSPRGVRGRVSFHDLTITPL